MNDQHMVLDMDFRLLLAGGLIHRGDPVPPARSSLSICPFAARSGCFGPGDPHRTFRQDKKPVVNRFGEAMPKKSGGKNGS
jgi:hypothetical protein